MAKIGISEFSAKNNVCPLTVRLLSHTWLLWLSIFPQTFDGLCVLLVIVSYVYHLCTCLWKPLVPPLRKFFEGWSGVWYVLSSRSLHLDEVLQSLHSPEIWVNLWFGSPSPLAGWLARKLVLSSYCRKWARKTQDQSECWSVGMSFIPSPQPSWWHY